MKDEHTPNPLSDKAQMLVAAYVLGDLTPDETAKFEQLVEQRPSLRQELYAMQASFDVIPQAIDTIEPPARLREAILSAHSAETQPTQRRWSSRSVLRLLAGLTALGALLLATDNFRLRNQLQFAQDMNAERVAAILQQPNSRLISLTGNTSDAAGTLLFTPGNWQEVIVSLGDLPPLPPAQIYRMWLELENGEVIYCGQFNTDQEGSVFVRFTPPDSPPQGVKATELFVTIGMENDTPDSSSDRVMEGFI